jgi:para-aminobenzoate synthetase component 1
MTAAPPQQLVVELRGTGTPGEVARRLLHLPHLAVLDSADTSTSRGRYSTVTADPLLWRDGRVDDTDCDDPFALAATWLEGSRTATIPGLPPFQGGVVGLFGYGLNRAVEAIPASRFDEFAAPDYALGLYDWVVSFDHHERRAWLVVNGHGLGPRDPADRLRQVQGWLAAPPRPLPRVTTLSPLTGLAAQFPLPRFPGVTSTFARPSYLAAVRRAVEYVHAGDCFQVNLSQRLLTPLAEHPFALFERLCERNPAPFAAYFDAGDFQVVSASPERFLEVSPAGEVVTRPIKGTRPRGKTPAEDAELARDLATSAKDRAENVMIVDLLRNDLGRVCEFGSVAVPRVCEVESFASVQHLVSEVRGQLRPGLTALDALRAAFPGGSVTGAPKVRAMEVIAELEPTARGPYCGGFGCVGFDGAADTSILIRTLTAGRGYLQFPVGGGITSDSDPAAEYEETLHKAAGLLRALTP